MTDTTTQPPCPECGWDHGEEHAADCSRKRPGYATRVGMEHLAAAAEARDEQLRLGET